MSSVDVSCSSTYVDLVLFAASRENRRVEFFGDLDEKEASQILDKFQHEAIQLLRQELIKELGADERSSTLMLIQQSKNYPIRRFTDEVGDEPLREHVIQTLRDVLATHKGVTGKGKGIPNRNEHIFVIHSGRAHF